MKTPSQNTRTRTRIPKSETRKAVDNELAAIDRAFKKVSATRKSTLAFLKKAGIVDSKGHLTKQYR